MRTVFIVLYNVLAFSFIGSMCWILLAMSFGIPAAVNTGQSLAIGITIYVALINIRIAATPKATFANFLRILEDKQL